MKKKFPKCSTLRSYSKYEGDGGHSDRRWLFQSFIPLARHRAKRFLWSGYSLDELTSVACVGLGDAIENYDPDTHKNGLAAYAIPWIEGALKRWITKNLSIASGERNEASKYKTRPGSVAYFGNVAKGDGEPHRDVSLDQEITFEADNSDDEVCGGSLIESVVDHRLKDFRGRHFAERLKAFRRGVDLKIRWRSGAWQWIGHSWFGSLNQGKPLFVGYGTDIEYGTGAHDARLFYADRKEFYRRGLGYFLRSRRMEKCRRQILPYKEPAWSKHKIQIKFGPAQYYRDQLERQRSFERVGFGPRQSAKERNASQPDWKRPTPKRKWVVQAHAKLKAEQATLLWSDDNLSDYEIWSVPTYSRALHESYFRPHRVPWLTAGHRLPAKLPNPPPFRVFAEQWLPGTGFIYLVMGEQWERIRLTKWMRFEHSPCLIGESDYGFRDVGFCLENWTALGDVAKLTGDQIGSDIVLGKPRKRDIRAYLKPDSPLVLLFWARQIIMWHYLRYWHPTEKIDARHDLQETV